MEFKEFPKLARLSRQCIVTEKIDGTNSSIYIGEDGEFLTGSRNRWITPSDDNFGFSRWAHEHKDELMELGPGHHFGEWWGSGIQRAYGLKGGEKRFSLFNTSRWHLKGQEPTLISSPDSRVKKYKQQLPECCHLVPVLYEGLFDTQKIEEVLEKLKKDGSQAIPGFMRPEGIVVYHVAGGFGFKKTCEKDESPKSLAGEG